jgi:hypothetical protein
MSYPFIPIPKPFKADGTIIYQNAFATNHSIDLRGTGVGHSMGSLKFQAILVINRDRYRLEICYIVAIVRFYSCCK